MSANDLPLIERLQQIGYGGLVSDALRELDVLDTVLSDRFRPLSDEMVLVGRAITIRLHSLPGGDSMPAYDDEYWISQGGHPQQRMMRQVANEPDGSVLVFDCGGDMQAAHFGELSCQLAASHGCRGMLIAGNCRDTAHISRMTDFGLFAFGARPNAFGGWVIRDINEPVYLPGHLTHYVKVNPGDYVFADRDGAQVIPARLLEAVLGLVEQAHEKETAERSAIAGGMPIDQVYRQFGVL